MDARPLINVVKCIIQEYYAYVFKIIAFVGVKMACCRKQSSSTDVDRGTMLVRDSHLPVVWVFGGPCAGKSSMCQRIIEKYHFMHIDCDTVLRFEAMTQSSRGLQISAKLNRREPIPDEMLVKILREIMPRNVKITNGYLLDNFPNSVDQGKLFEKTVCDVTALIYMKVSAESMTRRFVERRDLQRLKKASADAAAAYRMPTVLDVPLRPERVEMQIRNFEAVKPAVLNHYEHVLYIMNAEKNQDAIFRMADIIITEICRETNVQFSQGDDTERQSVARSTKIKQLLKSTKLLRKRQVAADRSHAASGSASTSASWAASRAASRAGPSGSGSGSGSASQANAAAGAAAAREAEEQEEEKLHFEEVSLSESKLDEGSLLRHSMPPERPPKESEN